MASLDSQQTWVPYQATKDCSQGFCSIYCPQWCYISYPPPPLEFADDSSSGPTFSPLVIVIIGILASAFLLVSYYTIVSKYCGGFHNLRRRMTLGRADDDLRADDAAGGGPHDDAWRMTVNDGLDDSVIRSIAVCKYRKGDGFVDGTDCSVCLAEFEEDETLRLLPKCSHAFHVHCIDTWLKSHSNCPLCRVVVVTPIATAVPLPPARAEQEEPPSTPQVPHETMISVEDVGRDGDREDDATAPKDPRRVHDDHEERDGVIDDFGNDSLRRSFSVDHHPSLYNRVLIADVLDVDIDQPDEGRRSGGGEEPSSSRTAGERSKGATNKSSHSVTSSRSSSGARSDFPRRHGRGNNSDHASFLPM